MRRVPATCFLLLTSVLVVQGRIKVATYAAEADSKHGRLTDSGHSTSAISINLTDPLCIVSEQFLSITIDAGNIRENWDAINFTMPRVINQAKGLTPAMLRVGGTSQDFLLFQDGRGGRQMHRTDSNFTMTTAQWDAVNEFVNTVEWDFIFGLNLLLRHNWPNGSWDSSNAELLLDYTTSKGYVVNWELGNEPDLFSDIKVSPEQNAKDHGTLKSLVTEKSSKTQYVVGPDTAGLSSYYSIFLESLQDGVINAATWHQYYENGHTALLPDFFTVTVLDKLIGECKTAFGAVQKYQPGIELWLGETSSCYGGGAPHLSNTYVAGFMWLDKLGIAALTNHTRVFRQTFVGGSYSLLDANLYPLPDYWLSLLYKRLVGTRVLNVSGALEAGRYVRAYAHCAKSLYPSGSVVLVLLNINTYDTNATLLNPELRSSSRDAYWLTPSGGSFNITSHEVTLNGKLLQLDGDELPDLVPEEQAAVGSVFLPALSFGFYVFKDAKAGACT